MRMSNAMSASMSSFNSTASSSSGRRWGRACCPPAHRHRLAEGEDGTKFRELLATLEETQCLHVQHRDRLKRDHAAVVIPALPSLQGASKGRYNAVQTAGWAGHPGNVVNRV
jgi:hypothetical protein